MTLSLKEQPVPIRLRFKLEALEIQSNLLIGAKPFFRINTIG